jgi:asparagine synthase (glutamine-hydrolysing)
VCGIAGFSALPLTGDQSRDYLRRMMRAIAHRGPEELGYYFDEHVGIATARLTILDSVGGRQPMSTPDGRYWLGFNGEIFNYLDVRAELEGRGATFCTRSDTEVLLLALQEWGTDALPRLNGQFAFVLYDRLSADLLLGRDRFGERPLFYATLTEGLVFASEIKGLFALPSMRRALSVGGLQEACTFWTPLPGHTCFEGVSSLPPGHYALYRSGELAIHRHYSLPFATQAPNDPVAAGDAVRKVVTDSVRARLHGDYEVSACISGGLDSAIVASIAQAEIGHPLRTFSLAFEQPELDESAHAQQVAEWLGTNHSTFTVTRADVRELFPTVVRQTEMPTHRTAPVASRLLADHVHQAGIRVVLGGEGADEVFLGYDIFKEAGFLDSFERSASTDAQQAWLNGLFHDAVNAGSGDPASILSFYNSIDSCDDRALGAHLRRFSQETFDQALGSGPPQIARTALLRCVRQIDPAFDTRSYLERAQVLDTVTVLSGYGLAALWDRAGAGPELEGRYPFLDPRVVDIAYALPADLKLHGGRTEKYILRETFADALPAPIVHRRKQGMRAPGAECLLLSDEDDWVAEVLSESTLRDSTLVDPTRARAIIARAHDSDNGSVPYPCNHWYLQLLSTLLLEEFYVRNFTAPDSEIDHLIIHGIDGRELASLGDSNE